MKALTGFQSKSQVPMNRRIVTFSHSEVDRIYEVQHTAVTWLGVLVFSREGALDWMDV